MSHDNAKLNEMIRRVVDDPATPKPSSVWKHYKGERYLVQGLAVSESTEEILVCYTAQNDPLQFSIPWTRPLEEWRQIVSHNGVPTQRFSPENSEQ